MNARLSHPLRILLAEDDAIIRTLGTRALSRSGYQVDSAADGAAAWQALNASPYDLLVTDNNMPELSGVELIEKLRAANMTLPVIMATGTLPEKLSRLPSLEPSATLLKPFTTDDLLGIVAEIFRAVEAGQRSVPNR